ncbi:MAG: hypothetical protein ACLVGL_01150 [Waltera sp.]
MVYLTIAMLVIILVFIIAGMFARCWRWYLKKLCATRKKTT